MKPIEALREATALLHFVRSSDEDFDIYRAQFKDLTWEEIFPVAATEILPQRPWNKERSKDFFAVTAIRVACGLIVDYQEGALKGQALLLRLWPALLNCDAEMRAALLAWTWHTARRTRVERRYGVKKRAHPESIRKISLVMAREIRKADPELPLRPTLSGTSVFGTVAEIFDGLGLSGPKAPVTWQMISVWWLKSNRDAHKPAPRGRPRRGK